MKELHQIVHQHWILRLGHCLRFSMVLFLGDAFKPKRSSSSWKSQTDILMATWGWNKILEACWVVEISSLSFCKRCSWIWWRFTQVSTMITKDIWQAKNSSGTTNSILPLHVVPLGMTLIPSAQICPENTCLKLEIHRKRVNQLTSLSIRRCD